MAYTYIDKNFQSANIQQLVFLFFVASCSFFWVVMVPYFFENTRAILIRNCLEAWAKRDGDANGRTFVCMMLDAVARLTLQWASAFPAIVYLMARTMSAAITWRNHKAGFCSLTPGAQLVGPRAWDFDNCTLAPVAELGVVASDRDMQRQLEYEKTTAAWAEVFTSVMQAIEVLLFTYTIFIGTHVCRLTYREVLSFDLSRIEKVLLGLTALRSTAVVAIGALDYESAMGGRTDLGGLAPGATMALFEFAALGYMTAVFITTGLVMCLIWTVVHHHNAMVARRRPQLIDAQPSSLFTAFVETDD